MTERMCEMSRVEAALEELVTAINESPEYREYSKQKELMRQHPDLKEKLDIYRREKYELQTSASSDELFDRTEELTGKSEELRKNPLMGLFLDAELDFCRMIQQVNNAIVEAVEFE